VHTKKHGLSSAGMLFFKKTCMNLEVNLTHNEGVKNLIHTISIPILGADYSSKDKLGFCVEVSRSFLTVKGEK